MAFGLCGIYKITNLVNGKVYIGLSKDITKRLKTHLTQLISNTHYNKHLQQSFNKYGKSNFVFQVVEECAEELLSNKEQQYILFFESFNPLKGFNKTLGGEREIPTKETKQKMSENHANVSGSNSPFYGKSLAGEFNPFYGKVHSEEARLAVSNYQSGRSKSNSTKLKMSIAHKNKSISDITKDKMSISHTGKKNPRLQLSDTDIFNIQTSSLPVRDISNLYKVSLSTIYKLRKL